MVRFPESAGVVIAAILCTVWIVGHFRQQQKMRAQRNEVFDACLELFTQPTLETRHHMFPVLTGCYQQHRFTCRLFIDTLVFRRLPVLWLIIDMNEPLHLSGSIDIVLRATGTEVFSLSEHLPENLQPPSHWPACRIKTDMPEAAQHLQSLQTVLNPLLFEPTSKSLTMTSDRLRHVFQVNQAERSEYLVLRITEFANFRVNSHRLQQRLDHMLALHKMIASHQV